MHVACSHRCAVNVMGASVPNSRRTERSPSGIVPVRSSARRKQASSVRYATEHSRLASWHRCFNADKSVETSGNLYRLLLDESIVTPPERAILRSADVPRRPSLVTNISHPYSEQYICTSIRSPEVEKPHSLYATSSTRQSAARTSRELYSSSGAFNE